MPYPISAARSRRFVAAYADRMRKLFGSAVIAYWPLWEAAGAISAADISGNGYNGTPSNVTFGATGIGDIRTAASFNGTTSYIDVFGAGLAAALNGAEGTFSIWAYSSNWGDNTSRNLLYLHDDDYTDVIYLDKHTTNALRFFRIGDGTSKNVSSNALSGLGWKHLAITWSETGDYLRLYIDGSSVGTPASAIGTYADDPTFWDIGANDAHGSVWNGTLAHAILLNRAATAPETAEVARASV